MTTEDEDRKFREEAEEAARSAERNYKNVVRAVFVMAAGVVFGPTVIESIPIPVSSDKAVCLMRTSRDGGVDVLVKNARTGESIALMTEVKGTRLGGIFGDAISWAPPDGPWDELHEDGFRVYPGEGACFVRTVDGNRVFELKATPKELEALLFQAPGLRR